jgi:hypothetical protein
LLPFERRASRCTVCRVRETNNSRLLNITREKVVLNEAIKDTTIRNKFDKCPKFWPVSTSTSSSEQEPRNPMRKARVSPTIIVNVSFFEYGMNPNPLLPRVYSNGYLQRMRRFMNLFQVSKELHRKSVDILKAVPALREEQKN